MMVCACVREGDSVCVCVCNMTFIIAKDEKALWVKFPRFHIDLKSRSNLISMLAFTLSSLGTCFIQRELFESKSNENGGLPPKVQNHVKCTRLKHTHTRTRASIAQYSFYSLKFGVSHTFRITPVSESISISRSTSIPPIYIIDYRKFSMDRPKPNKVL